MNRRAAANCRYQPTCYEHAANFYTHAVRLHPQLHPQNVSFLCLFVVTMTFAVVVGWVLFSCRTSAPGCAGLPGHGAAAPPVGHGLGAAHRLGVRPGAVRPLPGLHCLPHHHLEKESHEVRPLQVSAMPDILPAQKNMQAKQTKAKQISLGSHLHRTCVLYLNFIHRDLKMMKIVTTHVFHLK